MISSVEHFYICIMAGGSGERFWPLSRKSIPKHLLQLFSGKTLLEETLARAESIVSREKIFILTNQGQKKAIHSLLPKFPEKQIICEPAKRDTAPACALGTALALRRDPKAVVAMMASDHLIKNHSLFARQMKEAASLAKEKEAFFTFSISPTWASPDLGYLQLGKKIKTSSKTHFFEVDRFVEKPDAKTAAKYLKSGNFGWNSGMFVWSADFFLSEAKRLAPELAKFIENFPANSYEHYLAEKFPHLPKISVDYAIMEKAKKVIAARVEFDWDDVGYWKALENHLTRDAHGNAIYGRSAILDSSGNLVFSQKRLIALNGVKDLVVVETEDAILVSHRNEVAHLKKLISQLPEEVL